MTRVRTQRTDLPFTRPYGWELVRGYLGPRAIPGVECAFETHAGGGYARTFVLGASAGFVTVCPRPEKNALEANIHTIGPDVAPQVTARLRRLLDLDLRPRAMKTALGRDPVMRARLRKVPGLRVVGAWDPFELGVRAIVGQQVSVAAATGLAGVVAGRHGIPLHPALRKAAPPGLERMFPAPAEIASADLGYLPMPRARSSAIRGLAGAVAEAPTLFDGLQGRADAACTLERLPGIGPWTAQYIAMRALRDPDAWPASDLGLLRAMEVDGVRPKPAELAVRAEAWRPWRAYAAVCLWMTS